MRLAYKMEYLHPTDERTDIALVKYSSEYKEEYKRIYNECYHEMRAALDIKPYDFIQDDTFFDEGMGDVYLLLSDHEIIGSVALKNDEIDDLIVSRKYQGLGYGKKLLLWALDNIQAEKVVLHVADWNIRAINLYKKSGFRITETIEF